MTEMSPLQSVFVPLKSEPFDELSTASDVALPGSESLSFNKDEWVAGVCKNTEYKTTASEDANGIFLVTRFSCFLTSDPPPSRTHRNQR